jgi:HK97 family phage major capsid protein
VIDLATADTITKDELALCVNMVDQNARNRQWVVSPTGWAEVMGLAVSGIGYNVTDGVRPQIYGAPVTVSNYLPDGVHAVYGDFGMASALGYKPNGITVRASEERAIEFDQTVFVGTARYAFSHHSMQYLAALSNPVV